MRICERDLPTGVVCGEAIPCPHHGEEFASKAHDEATVVMLNDTPFAVVLGLRKKTIERNLEIATKAAEKEVRRHGWRLPGDKDDRKGELRPVVFVHTKPVKIYGRQD
jgi:hypothetical protein